MNCTTFASLYGATAQSGTGCSAVGSAPGLGPGGRPFESGHPDNKAKGRSKRNLQKGLAKRNKRCTFAAQLRNGALDEWLSQRSAKPSTAVRIRQAPPLKGKAIEKDIPPKGCLFCYVQGRDDGMFGGMFHVARKLGSPDKPGGEIPQTKRKVIHLHHEYTRTFSIGAVDSAIRDTFKL